MDSLKLLTGAVVFLESSLTVSNTTVWDFVLNARMRSLDSPAKEINA